jgi:hypothetical protein
MSGGNNYWPASYSQRTKLLYIPSNSNCNEVTLDPSLSNKAGDWKGATFRHIERTETDLVLADPFTGEIKKKTRIPYPNNSGALSTAGAWYSPVTPTERSSPTTTRHSTSSGNSTSARASTRRR